MCSAIAIRPMQRTRMHAVELSRCATCIAEEAVAELREAVRRDPENGELLQKLNLVEMAAGFQEEEDEQAAAAAMGEEDGGGHERPHARGRGGGRKKKKKKKR